MVANNRTYIGLSTEIKPYLYLNTGDFFFEQDTQVMYQWNGTSWVQYIVLQDLITGGTISLLTNTLTLNKYNGRYIDIPGFNFGSGTFTGGTVTGPTTFLTGVTFNDYYQFSGFGRTSTISGSCSPGSTTVLSYNTTIYSHRSIHVKYVIDDGTNMRAGSFVLVSDGFRSGTNYDFVDTSTNDIGDTSNYVLMGSTSGGINEITMENYGVVSVNVFFEYTLI